MQSIGMHASAFGDDVAHLTIDHNQVLGSHLLPGLDLDVEQLDDGIRAVMTLADGAVIDKPVHMCFGMLPREGLQRIVMETRLGENARVDVLAHCTFPNAVQVQHVMDGTIEIGPGARFSYFERHVHGPEGGVRVVPKARVHVREGGRFKTEFELLKGGVGSIDIDYETTCERDAVLDMLAKISAKNDDRVKIREAGHLVGENARGLLTSHIALRDRARADIENVLIAEAPGARGHVDCKEILRDQGVARAVPIVEVRHPRAHVTHEAAIGSVDSKQLETLMARGLTEDQASDLIIAGLLS